MLNLPELLKDGKRYRKRLTLESTLGGIMKKIGLVLFLVAAVGGILLAKMFSFGTIPVHLPSISFSNSVKGSGNVVSEKRNVAEFTAIEAGGAFLVEIAAGKEFSVTVEGDDNLLPMVTTKVNGKTLELSSEKNFSTRNRIKVVITAPKIEEIDASGASRFDVTGIDNENITVEMSGAAKVTLNGKAKSLVVDMGGASRLDALQMTAENATVDGGGASSAKVNATGELKVDVGGASRVRYAGTPKNIYKKTSGVASVNQVD
jgi:hypothetical protein